LYFLFFFFFQAEDGIRDGHVTGVQTCALPIFDGSARTHLLDRLGFRPELGECAHCRQSLAEETNGWEPAVGGALCASCATQLPKIGRASCRERVEITGVVGGVEKKRYRAG